MDYTPSAVTETDQTLPVPEVALANQAQEHAAAGLPWQHTSLPACLTALHALLPGVVGDGEQVRALMEVQQHDDLEWMLNAANAELHCSYAEQLQQLGRGHAAIDHVTKVSIGTSCTIASEM